MKELPPELEPVRDAARRALGQVIPAHPQSKGFERSPDASASDGIRRPAGAILPKAYIVYFLLVDLLGFKHSGPFEKTAWFVSVDYRGWRLTISHEKMGLGIFAAPSPEADEAARAVCVRIAKAAKAAEPYFDWRASQAVAASKLNVLNRADPLWETLAFFLRLYREKRAEAEARKDERIVTTGKNELSSWTMTRFPYFELMREAGWLATAAVEAFFSWTEHVFIHMAILQGRLRTGENVASRAGADWSEKFKGAISIEDREAKSHFDNLIVMRRELRNFVAHGAFGKDGQAFHFHSTAGAVPVLLPHRAEKQSFTLGEGLDFDHEDAIGKIDAFNAFIWAGDREPMKIHIQEYRLDSVLTLTSNGWYSEAMQSPASMKELCEHLAGEVDRAANMDW